MSACGERHEQVPPDLPQCSYTHLCPEPFETTTQIRGVATKFPEWYYSMHTCILTAYWEGSPSRYYSWAAMHLVQRCCHWSKHFWNTCCGTAFSAIVIFFFLMSSISWNLFFFWKQLQVIWSQISETGWVSHFSNQFWVRNCLTASCELEHSHGGESNHWTKVQAFFYA